MSNLGASATDLLRVEEQLRQERETFDHRKSQDTKWFSLRLRMGYTAAIMLPVIALTCGYVLLNHTDFPATVVATAGAALLVDVLGLLAAVWKVVLNPGSTARLEPIISDHSLNSSAETSSGDA